MLPLQPDVTADFTQMLAADAAEFGIVEGQKTGHFPALLYQVDVGEAVDAVYEAIYADQFAQDETGVVKTQGLIEIAHK